MKNKTIRDMRDSWGWSYPHTILDDKPVKPSSSESIIDQNKHFEFKRREENQPNRELQLMVAVIIILCVYGIYSIFFVNENKVEVKVSVIGKNPPPEPTLSTYDCKEDVVAFSSDEGFYLWQNTCVQNVSVKVRCHYSGCINNTDSDAKTCAITHYEQGYAVIDLYNEQPERSEIAHELFHVYQNCSAKFEDDKLVKESTAYLYSTTRSEIYYHSPLGYEWLAQGLNQSHRDYLVREIFDSKSVTLQWLLEKKNEILWQEYPSLHYGVLK